MYIWCTYVVLGLGLSSLVHYLCHISCEPADTTHTHTSAACVHSVMDTDSVLAFRAAGKEIKCNKWAAFLRDGKLCMHASSISTPQLLNALLPNASKSPASVFVLFISLQCLCIYSYCIYSIHQWHWSSTVVCLLAGRQMCSFLFLYRW